MSEPKPLASLSSSLLARKGHAKPAMRPQGFGGFGSINAAVVHDDLGWNDMGLEPSQVTADVVPIHPEIEAEAPATPIVHRQQEALARELAPAAVGQPPKPKPKPVARAAPGSKGTAAFTLRLNPERHLQLRLVCAVQHRSAQQVVIEALDKFLTTQPAVATLAASTSAKSR